jgi:hypothetical protein
MKLRFPFVTIPAARPVSSSTVVRRMDLSHPTIQELAGTIDAW